MMHLYGKLNALLDPRRVFQISDPADFSSLTPKIKKHICATKTEHEMHNAENFQFPDLPFEAADTAVLSHKFDIDGKLPTISRSLYEIEE